VVGQMLGPYISHHSIATNNTIVTIVSTTLQKQHTNHNTIIAYTSCYLAFKLFSSHHGNVFPSAFLNEYLDQVVDIGKQKK